MGWRSGGSEGELFSFPSGGTTLVCGVSELVLVVVVVVSGFLVEVMSVVAVGLAAASLTTGVKVKLSSVALPSVTWTFWTATDVYLWGKINTCLRTSVPP